MAYGEFKHLTRGTASDRILHDKAFNSTKNLKYEYQRGLSSMVYEFCDKRISGSGIKSENMLDQQLAKKITQTNY